MLAATLRNFGRNTNRRIDLNHQNDGERTAAASRIDLDQFRRGVVRNSWGAHSIRIENCVIAVARRFGIGPPMASPRRRANPASDR
jgi:hypothetical protein